MKPQSNSYEAPVAVRYGTVRGLTASTLKCSPGGDHALSAQYAEFATGGTDPTHPWVGDPDSLLADSPNFFASRDAAGDPIPYDGCTRS